MGEWLVLASIPFVAAAIGYVTKLLAIEMMFRPVEYRGLGPVGWQGVIPRSAGEMAAVVDSLVQKALDPEELVERIDIEALIERLDVPLQESVEDIATEIAREYYPTLWDRLPEGTRRLILTRLRSRAPTVARDLLGQLRGNLEDVIDLRYMVVSNLVRNKHVLNSLMRSTTEPELRFIIRWGAVFGFVLGVFQAAAYGITGAHLVMPLFGLAVGWSTDWLALKMLFDPTEEKRLPGGIRWQGLFFKRRHEFAEDYARAIARDLLTPRVLLESLLTGPGSDRFFVQAQRELQRAIDTELGAARPLVSLMIGDRRYGRIKQAVAERAVARLAETAPHVRAQADDQLDVEALMTAKMRQLSLGEYEALLRPAFEKHRWKLIAAGAVLGVLVGEVQAQIVIRL